MGGVVRAVSQLCRGLATLGVDVTVYTTNGSGDGWLDIPINQLVEIGGVKVYYFHTELPRIFRYSKALKEACSKNIRSFDIVHIASFWNYPGIPTGKEVRRNNIPYVISPHGTLTSYALSHSRLKKWLYMKSIELRNLKGAAAVHFTTEVEREATAHLRFQNASFVIPNGLDFKEFEILPSRNKAHHQLGIPGGVIVLTYLGYLDYIKKLDMIILAIARIIKKFTNVRLLIAGPDYGLESSLRDLVQKLGIQRYVTFIGFVDNQKRAQLLSATDLLILLSLSENFGYSAAEAMAAGVPVLVSDQVGIAPDVEEDKAGFVVPTDVNAIAYILEEILSHPERLKERGDAAYNSARKRYDIRVVAKKMLKAYEDILTGRRSPECHWSDLKQSMEVENK
jgi:glycosyltransferase involved in cell wall biosynthesis